MSIRVGAAIMNMFWSIMCSSLETCVLMKKTVSSEARCGCYKSCNSCEGRKLLQRGGDWACSPRVALVFKGV